MVSMVGGRGTAGTSATGNRSLLMFKCRVTSAGLALRAPGGGGGGQKRVRTCPVIPKGLAHRPREELSPSKG